jgi:hypothetical protein
MWPSQRAWSQSDRMNLAWPFQGRDRYRDLSRVASATVEDSVVADATGGLCRAFPVP